MKTVDGSKYSVHASSILESHDMSEPVVASASSKVYLKLFVLSSVNCLDY